MKIKYITFIVLICHILSGCLGDDSDDSNASPYAGIWYNESGKYYLEIENNNTVLIRNCTLNDGYAPTYTGSINGDKMDLNSFTYNLSLEGNTLSIVDESGKVFIQYIKETSIPAICTDDAIEITFSSPTSVTEGMMTTFEVNFDYRLTSTNSGIVYVGFNTGEANAFTLTTSTFEVYSSGTGSASLSADITPVLYSLPDTFMIYLNLSENPHPDSWSPLASDVREVKVNPATVKVHFKTFSERVGKQQFCSDEVFIQCFNE